MSEPESLMSLKEFTERYLRPAVDELWRKVQNGEPLTALEAELIHSLGRESASWALNVKLEVTDAPDSQERH